MSHSTHKASVVESDACKHLNTLGQQHLFLAAENITDITRDLLFKSGYLQRCQGCCVYPVCHCEEILKGVSSLHRVTKGKLLNAWHIRTNFYAWMYGVPAIYCFDNDNRGINLHLGSLQVAPLHLQRYHKALRGSGKGSLWPDPLRQGSLRSVPCCCCSAADGPAGWR